MHVYVCVGLARIFLVVFRVWLITTTNVTDINIDHELQHTMYVQRTQKGYKKVNIMNALQKGSKLFSTAQMSHERDLSVMYHLLLDKRRKIEYRKHVFAGLWLCYVYIFFVNIKLY